MIEVKNISEKNLKIIITITLIITIILSIFVISPIVSNPDFHANTIEILEAKKMKVVGWSTGTISAATVLALIPGDTTTPLANQILQLNSYFLIVIGAIFLEEVLLTLTGNLTFSYLIPISCFLVIIYLYYRKEFLKQLAIKLTIFGIVICLVIPISIKVSDSIELSYETSLNQDAKEIESIDVSEENTKNESSGIFDGITSKIQEGLSNIGSGATKVIAKGEKMLSNLIDTVAVFIITSCVIPVLVLLCMVWIVKIMFNINIPSIKLNKLTLKRDNTKE